MASLLLTSLQREVSRSMDLELFGTCRDNQFVLGIQWWRCPSRRLDSTDLLQLQRISRTPAASRRKRIRVSVFDRLVDSDVDSDGDLPRLSDIMGNGIYRLIKYLQVTLLGTETSLLSLGEMTRTEAAGR